MNENEIARILKENAFELTMGDLKTLLSDVELRKLAEWVDKYKVNLRKFKKMQIDYSRYIMCPADYWEGDSRYIEGDYTPFVVEDAPEEAKVLFNMQKDYEYFGNSLPIIEFPRSEIYG